jgi:hypothetical protein
MAMTSSANGADGETPGAPLGAARLLGRTLAALESFTATDSTSEALARFGEVADALGASSASFVSFIRDDALLASYRSLHIGQPAWAGEYARGEWFGDDAWLDYAMHESEPIQAGDITPKSPRQRSFVEQAARLGYARALIVPAPSPQGQSRVGVLYLGSERADAFTGGTFASVRLLARSLAMELHGWMRRSVRDELVRRTRISSGDIELLRHELAGHSSKVIASMLNTEAKTIDCRFQRVSAKLGAANRRAAVRVALLYGLL